VRRAFRTPCYPLHYLAIYSSLPLTSTQETVLAFERRQHNRSIAREGEAPNAPLKAITRAQFFYLDRFVLLASLHQLLLYSYAIDTSVDDVKRYLSSSRYTLSSSICQPGPHSITTFAAANGFLSHVVLSAGSDKCAA
jgi:hypothetical protein